MGRRQWQLLFHALILLQVFSLPQKTEAAGGRFEIGLLAGTVDGGDGRQNPSAGWQLGWAGDRLTRILYTPITVGDLSQRQVSVAIGKIFPLAGKGGLLSVLAGGAVLDQYSLYSTTRSGEHDFNVAGVMGVRFRLLDIAGMTFDCHWDSYVMPAGFAVIFLTIARKELLACSAGVAL